MMAPKKSGAVARRRVESFIRAGRSSRPPDQDACCFEFLFQHQEGLTCRLDVEASTFKAGTFNGVHQDLYTRQTLGDGFGLYKHERRPPILAPRLEGFAQRNNGFLTQA